MSLPLKRQRTSGGDDEDYVDVDEYADDLAAAKDSLVPRGATINFSALTRRLAASKRPDGQDEEYLITFPRLRIDGLW